MMSVVIYARKGSNPEVDYMGLNAWAEENNALVHKRFCDTSSGTSDFKDRLVLSEAIVAARIYNCDAILMKNISTIGRSQESVTDNLNACFRNNLCVYFADEGIFANKHMPESVSKRIMEISEKEETKVYNTVSGMKKGRNRAMKKGVHMGRRKGSIKSDEILFEEYSDVIDLLEQGVPIRKTAKALGISTGTVQKIKNKFINKKENED